MAAAAGIPPGAADSYFDGQGTPPLTDKGVKTLHAVLAACGITEPEQVLAWTEALIGLAITAPRVGHGESKRAEPAADPAVLDVPGVNLCPDPLTAKTPADLLRALSLFRILGGAAKLSVKWNDCPGRTPRRPRCARP